MVSITSDFIAGATAYIDGVAVGIEPLLWLFIGVPLAFWFLGKIIDLVKLK